MLTHKPQYIWYSKVLAHKLFPPTTNVKAEYGVEYDSCALPRQGKGRKQKITPVLRSCIGAAVSVVQSRGCETKEKREREEEDREKRKKGNRVLYSHPVGMHFQEWILLLLGSYLYLYNWNNVCHHTLLFCLWQWIPHITVFHLCKVSELVASKHTAVCHWQELLTWLQKQQPSADWASY